MRTPRLDLPRPPHFDDLNLTGRVRYQRAGRAKLGRWCPVSKTTSFFGRCPVLPCCRQITAVAEPTASAYLRNSGRSNPFRRHFWIPPVLAVKPAEWAEIVRAVVCPEREVVGV